MTNYSRLKEAIERLGYVPMTANCTLVRQDEKLIINSFNRPMLTFFPDGTVQINTYPQRSSLQSDLVRINSYLPDYWKIVPEDFFWSLENTQTDERWVYKPNMSFKQNGEVVGAGNYKESVTLIARTKEYAKELVEAILHTPEVFYLRIDPEANPDWIRFSIDQGVFSQLMFSEIIDGLKDQQTFMNIEASAISDYVFPEKFIRPTLAERPPKPKEQSDPEGNCQYCTYFHGGSYSGYENGHLHNSRLICGFHPYGWEGRGDQGGIDCRDYKLSREVYLRMGGDPVASTYETWKKKIKQNFHDFNIRKATYRTFMKTLLENPSVQSRLTNEVEAVLKEKLKSIGFFF